MHKLSRILLLATLASTPLHAQVVMGTTAEGTCTCSINNGKSFPCRQARGDPSGGVLTLNRCNLNGGYRLVCPEDPSAICHYDLVPPTCTEPPPTPVCWAADEPK